MNIQNWRNSSKFNGCSPLQSRSKSECNLIGKRSQTATNLTANVGRKWPRKSVKKNRIKND